MRLKLFNNRMVSSFFILTILLAAIILLIIYFSYEAQKVRAFKSHLESDNGNLHIFVINLNFRPSVNLDVYMEDTKMISRKYLYEGDHAYKESKFEVKTGVYNFKLYSPDLNLERNEKIDINDTPWILIMIEKDCYSEPRFVIHKK